MHNQVKNTVNIKSTRYHMIQRETIMKIVLNKYARFKSHYIIKHVTNGPFVNHH